MKKLIVTLLLFIWTSVAPAAGVHYYYEWYKAIGIHKIELNSPGLVTIDLDKDIITTDITSYEIIEPPKHWIWDKKHKEKYCIFLCTNESLDKVFIKMIEVSKEFYIIKVFDKQKSYYYHSKKVYLK